MKDRRLRDPIHGLIVFDGKDRRDILASKLVDTPEFQRLRRIKQLGVSEYVYPGASHSRLSHSIGVFFNARKLLRRVEEIEGKPENETKRDKHEERIDVILAASLLHDVGHGPFSHAFEGAGRLMEKKFNFPYKDHEKFSSDIILNEEGEVFSLLEKNGRKGLAEEVASLLRAETPSDYLHAIVSSSFDADRLDYLVRDRYMTGTAAGAIDLDWLFDNIVIHTVNLSRGEEEEEKVNVKTIAFKHTAQQAAEDFLLARYRLYEQVYLHRVTRGFEQILKALLYRIAEVCIESPNDTERIIGLSKKHPLCCYFMSGGKLEHYLRLDDAVVFGAFEAVERSSDVVASPLARRLIRRQKPYSLDLKVEFADLRGEALDEAILNATQKISSRLREKLDRSVFLDEAPLNLYGRVGDSAEREHKKVRVVAHGRAFEITDLNRTVVSRELTKKLTINRFYFLDEEDLREARDVAGIQ